jgi:hypothetical protein
MSTWLLDKRDLYKLSSYVELEIAKVAKFSDDFFAVYTLILRIDLKAYSKLTNHDHDHADWLEFFSKL